jgi:hypothetical protein
MGEDAEPFFERDMEEGDARRLTRASRTSDSKTRATNGESTDER